MTDETQRKQPGAGPSGPLRGRGSALGVGRMAETLRQRAEQAAASAPSVRAIAERTKELTNAAAKEAQRRRPEAERAARGAATRAGRAADADAPEAERLAQRARSAAAAAKPRVLDAAERTTDFVREHETELRSGAARAARVTARTLTPAPLRSAVDALEQELRAGGTDTPGSTEPSSTAPREDAENGSDQDTRP